jgi:hypothetical protein
MDSLNPVAEIDGVLGDFGRRAAHLRFQVVWSDPVQLSEIAEVVEEPGYDIVLNLVDKRSIVIKTENLIADELAAFLITLRGLIGKR